MRKFPAISILRLAVFFLFLSGAFGQAIYRLPQVANGANLIRTTFIFINNSDSSSTVTLTITDNDGNLLNLSIPGLNDEAVKVFILPARESRFYSTDGAGELKVGAGRVVATSEIGVAAVFSLLGDGGSTLLTEAGIGSSRAVSEFAIAVDTKAPFNTGVAIQNLGSEATTLSMTLYDNAGALRVSRNDVQLPRQGHLAQFISGPGGLFPDEANLEGRLVVSSSTTQVSALTLRQNAASGAPLTTLPAVPTLSNKREFYLPQVANGFEVTLGIKTQFIFFSLGTAAEAHLSLTRDDGKPFQLEFPNGPAGAEFDFDIPAGGAVFVETDGEGTITTGAAHVTSDVPIGVTAVFSLLNAERVVTVEAGIGDSPLGNEFSLPVDLTGGFNTGVAVFNPNEQAAEVGFILLAGDGTKTAEKTISIPASGHRAVFVQSLQLFPGVSNLQGQLNLNTALPVSALSLRQQVSTGNLTTLPVVAGIPDPGTDPTPSTGNLLRKSLSGLDFSSNSTLDVQLEAGYKLSGNIQHSLLFIPVGLVQAISPAGDVYMATATGGLLQPSHYEMVVPKGAYLVRACTVDGSTVVGIGSATPAPAAISEYSATFVAGSAENVIVAGDTTKDLSIASPTYRTVSGFVAALSELPEEATSQTLFLALGSENSNTQAFTSLDVETGAFQIKVAAGSYSAGLVFGEGTDTDGDNIPDDFQQLSVIWDIGSVTVENNDLTNVTFFLPDLAEVKGKIVQPDTADFSQSQVLAFDLAFPQASLLTQCVPIAGVGASLSQATAAGDYRLTLVKSETYDVLAAVPLTQDDGTITAPLPGSDRKTFTDESTTLDRPVPAKPATVTVTGMITSPNGTPVSGASVSATTVGGLVGAPNASFSASTVTDAGGNYSLELLSGFNYVVEVEPPNAP